MIDLSRALKEFGANDEGILYFDEPGPRLLTYSALLDARSEAESSPRPVVGVYEWQ